MFNLINLLELQIPAPDKDPNTVLDVQKIGYILHGRTIRPAAVGVSRKWTWKTLEAFTNYKVQLWPGHHYIVWWKNWIKLATRLLFILSSYVSVGKMSFNQHFSFKDLLEKIKTILKITFNKIGWWFEFLCFNWEDKLNMRKKSLTNFIGIIDTEGAARDQTRISN